MEPNAVTLNILEPAGIARRREYTAASVPLARGVAIPRDSWVIVDAQGEQRLCQTQSLATWSDGSIKWLQVILPVDIDAGGQTQVKLRRGGGDRPSSTLRVIPRDQSVVVDTGICQFAVTIGEQLLAEVSLEGRQILAEGLTASLTSENATTPFRIVAINVVESGPYRARIAFQCLAAGIGLQALGHWTFFADSALAQLEITLHNPSRARHPKNCWDLGDAGSVLLDEFSLACTLAGQDETKVQWREAPQHAFQEQTGGIFEIYQDSSGGENFQSRNHVNREGRIPIQFRGYRVRTHCGESFGSRAEPTCVIRRGQNWLAAVVPEFWQQFPKAFHFEASCLRIGLLPSQCDDIHELQGGEQKTFHATMLFGTDQCRDLAPLAFAQAPVRVHVPVGYSAATGAVFRLPSAVEHTHPRWQETATASLSETNGFSAKRETIDEYSWRHYGDLWADHEEAYYHGQKPVSSHYNNQYDALEGLLLSHLLTGDERWWQLADPLARHTIDIDLYHTSHDRAAYNGGMFWHTNHYRDAETSSHRAFSRINHPNGGGGPSNEHNYSSGLLLYFYLTGDSKARDAVLSLAEWVMNMDDPRGHVLGLVSDLYTGFASRTAEEEFHGPGRGVGNSINVLLDGYLASRNREFLQKAEQLVRRTISPLDEIADFDLSNAELRWSYTVMLQSLIRWLAQWDECAFSQDFAAYLRQSLLHYARWMANHEAFYLDQPEKLEFPTETWAAQEIRKANVLRATALFADSEDSELLRFKADYFSRRAWETLATFPTRYYTRPLVLALQLGLTEAWLAEQPESLSRFAGREREQLHPQREHFVSQKQAFRRNMRSPRALGMVMRLGRFWRWNNAVSSTWVAQRLRSWLGRR